MTIGLPTSPDPALPSSNLHSHPQFHFILIFILICSTIFITACGGNNPSSGVQPPVTSNPSDDDIVEAVRRSVNGKTYSVRTDKERTVMRTCSQIDVDMDPYMPRNPELAKCPSVGHRYQTTEYYSVTETKKCAALPPAGTKNGWSVVERGNDQWRVSNGGKVWDVTRLSGASVNLKDTVKVSSFTFQIKPHQDC